MAKGKSEERTSVNMVSKIDWLAVAIGNVGGVNGAAKRFNVQPATIYQWLNRGVGHLKFDRVVEISQAGNVPLDYLARRCSEFGQKRAA